MPLRMISVCYTAEKSEEAPALGKDEEEQEELVGVEAQTNEVLVEEVIKTNDDLDSEVEEDGARMIQTIDAKGERKHLAPWDLEPAAPHAKEDQRIRQELIRIREHLRRGELSTAACEHWVDRLRSVAGIVEEGCRSNGNVGAGFLLLDMVGDLLRDFCSSRICTEQPEGMEESVEEITFQANSSSNSGRTPRSSIVYE